MTKNQEELKRIIREHLQLEPMADLGCSGLYLSMSGVEALVQAILSAGYIKLSDVELDLEKLGEFLLPFIGYDIASGQLFFREGIEDAIAQAKPLIYLFYKRRKK